MLRRLPQTKVDRQRKRSHQIGQPDPGVTVNVGDHHATHRVLHRHRHDGSHKPRVPGLHDHGSACTAAE
jgi:hypothetical protein